MNTRSRMRSPHNLLMERIFQLALMGTLLMAPAFSKEAQKQPTASSSSSSFLRQLQGGFDEDFSCNVQADRCTFKANGQCDNTNAAGNCVDGDCWDCDLCRQNYDFDCNSCLQQTGCFWCPGDARCYNSKFYGIRGASCGVDDYTDTCNVPGDVNYFDDPLFSAQRWVYDMINVEAVWEKGYLGAGVRVRVNDNGVESTHPEFDDRFDRDGSCEDPDIPDHEFVDGGANHGTSVAGIVGGGANNGLCSVGVAPEVTLSACYALDSTRILAEKLDSFDISQNSFGTDGCARKLPNQGRHLQEDACPFVNSNDVCNSCDFSTRPLSDQCEGSILSHCRLNFETDEAACLEFLDLLVQNGRCNFVTLSSGTLEDLASGILTGRDGKGIIYVFASGNAFAGGDNTNFQGFTNSRLVITVGAVGKDGSHASYSTPGASVFVTGPGGDAENHSNHVTTGIDGACTNAGQGTSFSCPVVSGVIALMLEANPELTWRDVQGIIATTSTRVEGDPDDVTGEVNGAGLWHSNLYGFGIVDALAAVEAAEAWELYGPEQPIIGESGILDLPLSDLTKATSTVDIPSEGNQGVVAEAVEILLDLRHTSRGHLQITLISPSGMKSVLTPGGRPEDSVLGGDERWKLLTVRHWNESPVGEWKLEVLDTKEGDVNSECVDREWVLPNNNQGIDCNAISVSNWCVNGAINENAGLDPGMANFLFNTADADGFTAKDACCSCGGGVTAEEVVEELRQWRLVIYGRSGADTSTPSPTKEPTPSPTKSPVSSPTTESPVSSPTTESPASSPTTESPVSTTMAPTSSSPVSVPDGCTEVGGFFSCPTNSVFSFTGETWTLDVDVLCPVDAVAESSFTAATQQGLCQCETTVISPADEETDVDCDCSPCPIGGEYPFSYTCSSPIVSGCRSFSCTGECGEGAIEDEVPTSPRPTPMPTVKPEIPSVTIILATDPPVVDPTTAPADASCGFARLGFSCYAMALTWPLVLVLLQ